MELTNSDLLLPLWLLLLLLFLAHWAAVLGYGPGRPEAAGKRCEARAGAPGALGHLLAHGVELPRPTTAEVAWCRSCEAEKPPAAWKVSLQEELGSITMFSIERFVASRG